jgi:hypothetical protein
LHRQPTERLLHGRPPHHVVATSHARQCHRRSGWHQDERVLQVC